MNKKLVLKSILAVMIAVFFASCDKDFNNFGTDVIGDNHFQFDRDTVSTVVAFNQEIGVLQTNNPTTTATTNISVNSLGVYNNPNFGKTKASFVTQLQLASTTTVFGTNIVIDSVYLSVPYFSKKLSTTNGVGTYQLDSVYRSSENSKFRLSIYESGYVMNDLDPASSFQQPMRYYNNDMNFEAYKKGAGPDGSSISNGQRLNNSSDVSQNDAFVFSNAEIVTKKINTSDSTKYTLVRTAPAMRLKLNSNFFKKKIIEASSENITNNVTFKNYFRGLYFQVEEIEGTNNLAMMDFTKGTITLYYKETKTTIKADGTSVSKRVSASLAINMTGNRVNLLEETDNATNSNYRAAIASPNAQTGDSKLYLKGGKGSMAIIDLFGRNESNKGETAELDNLKTKGWLINEANLTFFVDKETMINNKEPLRVYLYDLTNNRPLIDYSTDGSTSRNTKLNKTVFGGNLEVQKDSTKAFYKRGIQYKIRITNHIKNLLSKDSTNVRLGLVVSESINDPRNAKLFAPTTNTLIDRIPVASVTNPFGTILYGSTPDVPEDRKLKLEIYYTKPN